MRWAMMFCSWILKLIAYHLKPDCIFFLKKSLAPQSGGLPLPRPLSWEGRPGDRGHWRPPNRLMTVTKEGRGRGHTREWEHCPHHQPTLLSCLSLLAHIYHCRTNTWGTSAAAVRVAELPSVHTPSRGVTVCWHVDFSAQLSHNKHVPSALILGTRLLCSLLEPHFPHLCTFCWWCPCFKWPLSVPESCLMVENGGGCAVSRRAFTSTWLTEPLVSSSVARSP